MVKISKWKFFGLWKCDCRVISLWPLEFHLVPWCFQNVQLRLPNPGCDSTRLLSLGWSSSISKIGIFFVCLYLIKQFQKASQREFPTLSYTLRLFHPFLFAWLNDRPVRLFRIYFTNIFSMFWPIFVRTISMQVFHIACEIFPFDFSYPFFLAISRTEHHMNKLVEIQKP